MARGLETKGRKVEEMDVFLRKLSRSQAALERFGQLATELV